MTMKAWQGWRKLHVNPLVAICYYFCANAGLHFASIWLVTGMTAFRGIYLYMGTFLFSGFIVLGILTDLIFWRCGPEVVNHKLFPVFVALSAAMLLPQFFLSCFGPMNGDPYENWIFFNCWGSCAAFFHSHVLAAGGTKGEHPLHPRTSIFWPFMRANVRAIQIMDALTDVEVIKNIMEQKASGCWWFGEEGNCRAWNHVFAAFASFWCLKVFLTISSMVSGGESSVPSRRKKRLLFVSEVIALVCEIGVGCCTLLQIFSLQASGVRRDLDESKLKSQMAIGMMSLIATCAALVVMLLGVSATLRAMSSIWNKVQPITVDTTGVIRPSFSGDQSEDGGSPVLPFEWDED